MTAVPRNNIAGSVSQCHCWWLVVSLSLSLSVSLSLCLSVSLSVSLSLCLSLSLSVSLSLSLSLSLCLSVSLCLSLSLSVSLSLITIASLMFLLQKLFSLVRLLRVWPWCCGLIHYVYYHWLCSTGLSYTGQLTVQAYVSPHMLFLGLTTIDLIVLCGLSKTKTNLGLSLGDPNWEVRVLLMWQWSAIGQCSASINPWCIM